MERPVALVTGAGRRLGAAIARALAARGYDLALHFHGSAAGAGEVADEVRAGGGRAELVRADLSDADAPSRLIATVVERFGRLDVLVSSAANFERVELSDATAAHFDRAMALNARAPFLLAQAARRELVRRRGTIVVITCSSTTLPYPNYLPYVVSKAAAKQLVRGLAIELAPHVRVNAVAPGTVLPPESMSEGEREALGRRTLVGRVGEPEDVVRAVLFAIESPFMTGQEILVDGGVTLAGRYAGEG